MFTSDEIHAIPLAGDEDLDFYRFASDPGGASIDAVLDQVRNIPGIATIGGRLKSWWEKFKFGSTPREIWKRKYRYSESGNTFAFDRVVNASPADVIGYVDALKKLAKEKNTPVLMMTGGVGTGKSTFNKLVTTNFHGVLKEARIIGSRVEFQKLREHVDSYSKGPLPLDEVARAFVFGCLLRDIAFAIYTRESDDDAGPPFELTGKCQLPDGVLMVDETGEINAQDLMNRICEHAEDPHYCAMEITPPDVQRFITQFSRYTKLGPSDRSGLVSFWAKYFLIEQVSARTTAAVAEIFVKIVLDKMKIFLIFDGFDFINVMDYREQAPVRVILDWLADTTVNGDGHRLPISRQAFFPIVQITIRESTNQLFWRKRCASHSQKDFLVLTVESPSYDQVISGLDALAGYDTPDSAEVVFTLIEILNGSVEHLRQRLLFAEMRANCDFSPADLFQNNVRHVINYLRDVLEIEIDRAITKLRARAAPITPRTLANELRAHYELLVKAGGYAFVQILLSSRSGRYRNFMTVGQTDTGELLLSDNDNASGYVGNILNYHAEYRPERSLREFCHKLLLLAYMCENDRQMPSHVLAQYVHFDQAFIELSLQIMIREGMVEAYYNDQDGQLLFGCSLFGRIVFFHLLYEVSYLEEVFFGARIPRQFIDAKLQDVKRSQGVSAWVQGSLANISLLLRMLKTGSDAYLDLRPNDPLKAVLEKMIETLGRAFTRRAHGPAGEPEILSAKDVKRILDRQTELLG